MKCPACSTEMTKRTSYDVEIEMCVQHGMWLDKGELAKILETFAEQNRPTNSGSDQRQTGRYEGMFFGWLSLFFPK